MVTTSCRTQMPQADCIYDHTTSTGYLERSNPIFSHRHHPGWFTLIIRILIKTQKRQFDETNLQITEAKKVKIDGPLTEEALDELLKDSELCSTLDSLQKYLNLKKNNYGLEHGPISKVEIENLSELESINHRFCLFLIGLFQHQWKTSCNLGPFSNSSALIGWLMSFSDGWDSIRVNINLKTMISCFWNDSEARRSCRIPKRSYIWQEWRHHF